MYGMIVLRCSATVLVTRTQLTFSLIWNTFAACAFLLQDSKMLTLSLMHRRLPRLCISSDLFDVRRLTHYSNRGSFL